MALDSSWLKKRSQLSPTKIAVIDGETGERWNYKQMYDCTINMAGRLLELEVQKGDRVALLSPNKMVYFDLLFACCEVGAIFVPLNWRLSEEELAFILKDCDAKFVFVHEEFEEKITHTQSKKIPIWEKNCNPNKILFNLETLHAHEDDPAAIIYTGGTTGKPKGVILTHKNIASNAINTVLSWGLKEEDTTLTCLPMFHTGGLNALSTPLLMAGGTVVIMQDFEVGKVLDLLDFYQCTVVLMVPTMYHLMMEHPRFQEENFNSMKIFLSGGAPCPMEVYEAFFQKGKLFKEGYGLTEAGPNNFFIDPNEAYEKKGSVGKPMMFNQVKIVNSKKQEAGVNEVGEIYLHGPHVFGGYWLNQEETLKVMEGNWLKTGDLGRRDEDGYYYIVGRVKDLIISGGENIYPSEIEHVLCHHESVKEACVIGVPHAKWGEVVVALVCRIKPISEQELQTFCSRSLGKYKIPQKFIFITELPKTAVGKINKKDLYERYRGIFIHDKENNGKLV